MKKVGSTDFSPRFYLKKCLDEYDMSQTDLAMRLGISKKTINEILMGIAPISYKTSLKLSYIFNKDLFYWSRLESDYRTYLENICDDESLEKETVLLNKYPYYEMKSRKWPFISNEKEKYNEVYNLRKFFSVSSLSCNTSLKNDLLLKENKKMSCSFEYLYSWARYGEITAVKSLKNNFDEAALKIVSNEIASFHYRSFEKNYEKIYKLLFNCGVSLIWEPSFVDMNVMALSYNLSPNKAMIMIGANYDVCDSLLWYLLFHSIGHLLKHSKKEIYVDYSFSIIDPIEEEADLYAANMLIDKEKYNSFVNIGDFSSDSLEKFSKNIGIQPSLLVFKLKFDGIILK